VGDDFAAACTNEEAFKLMQDSALMANPYCRHGEGGLLTASPISDLAQALLPGPVRHHNAGPRLPVNALTALSFPFTKE
jgi:hypothetical protein